MIPTAIRMRGLLMTGLTLSSMGLVGCNSDTGQSAAPPPSSALPVVPKEVLGPDGRATHSTPSLDTARGAPPSK
jgi:hypothetical protein